MREYIYSVMTDEKKGFFAGIIRAILRAVSWFYEAALAIIKFGYKKHFLKSEKPFCKVISVGNISLGGTGKTPAACMVANMLKKKNKKPAVLIRGYGQDEWKMLKEILADIPVIVGPDRVKNSRYAISKYNADTVVLDDGFQHWRIRRDLDLVLVDATNPFGNGFLFPRGVLREKPAALKRADILVLTKTDMGNEGLEELKTQLRKLRRDLPVLESFHKPKYLYELFDKNKRTLDLAAIKDKSIACLSSIVNTEYFEFTLKKLGAVIKMSFHYPDHHRYHQKDIAHIANECRKENIGAIITTEKDAPKLKAYSLQLQPEADQPTADKAFNVLVLHVELEVTNGEEILLRRLDSLYTD